VRVLWTRLSDKITFTRPNTWFCLGLRGEAKSSFLEHVGMNYLEKGAVVFDLFASRDGENLAWLRSSYAKDKKILLLKGENVDVKASFPVKQIDALTLSDVENYDIIISSSPLYLNTDSEFYYAGRVTDLLYKRLHYKRLVYLVIREAANFYYSRLKVSENQVAAKANMIYLIREGRHCGLALGLDSLRFYAIDIDIRNLSDYLILKSQGVQGLAKDLEWLYSFFDPAVIRKMPRGNFVVVSKSGALGLGDFPYHSWHKEEKEDILASVGIRVEYGEPVEQGQNRGRRGSTIGDKEHSQIIEMYISGLSMSKINKQINRSTKSIKDHVDAHNSSVERSGFCPSCRRVKSQHEGERAVCG
jgi:hypothetical protein